MNKIFSVLIIFSICVLIFTSPDKILSTMISSSTDIISLCLSLAAIYCVWLSVLEVVEKCGLADSLAKKLYRPIKKIFKVDDKVCIKYIALNLSANFLGLGNAATPSGIKAIQHLNNFLPKTKFAMFMLLVVNSTSIQLLPTTTIGLRVAANSQSASDIILPTFLATLASTIVGVMLLYVFDFVKKKRNK